MSDYSFTYEPKREGDVVVILAFYFLCLFIFTCLIMVKFDVHVNNSSPPCFHLLILYEILCVDLLSENSCNEEILYSLQFT